MDKIVTELMKFRVRQNTIEKYVWRVQSDNIMFI